MVWDVRRVKCYEGENTARETFRVAKVWKRGLGMTALLNGVDRVGFTEKA